MRPTAACSCAGCCCAGCGSSFSASGSSSSRSGSSAHIRRGSQQEQPAGAAGTGSKPLRPRAWLRCCCQGPGAALAGSTHPHIRSHGSKKQQRQQQARRAQPEVLVRSAAAPRRQPLPPGGLSQAAPPPLQEGILTRARGWPKSHEWAALAAQGHALAGAQPWTTHLCCEGATPIPDS